MIKYMNGTHLRARPSVFFSAKRAGIISVNTFMAIEAVRIKRRYETAILEIARNSTYLFR